MDEDHQKASKKTDQRVETYLKKYYGSTLQKKEKDKDTLDKFKKTQQIILNKNKVFTSLKSKSPLNQNLRKDKFISSNCISKNQDNKYLQIQNNKNLIHEQKTSKRENIYINKNINKKIKKTKNKIQTVLEDKSVKKQDDLVYFTFEKKEEKDKRVVEKEKNEKVVLVKSLKSIKEQNELDYSSIESINKIFKNSKEKNSGKDKIKTILGSSIISGKDFSNFSSIDKHSDSKLIEGNKLDLDTIRLENTERKNTIDSSSLAFSETMGKIKFDEENDIKNKYKANKKYIYMNQNKKIIFDSLDENNKQSLKRPNRIFSERVVNIFNFINVNKNNLFSSVVFKQMFEHSQSPIDDKNQGLKKPKYDCSSLPTKVLNKIESKKYFNSIFQNNYKLIKINSKTPHQFINSDDESDDKLIDKFLKNFPNQLGQFSYSEKISSSDDKKQDNHNFEENLKVIEEIEDENEINDEEINFVQILEKNKEIEDSLIKISNISEENSFVKNKKKTEFAQKNSSFVLEKEKKEKNEKNENKNSGKIKDNKEFDEKLDLIIFWMIDRKAKIIQRTWKEYILKKTKLQTNLLFNKFLKKKKKINITV